MIPRIAERGSSFKGAGQYYLHDKGKDTSERVAWTYIHNIPTDDPEVAMKWMAYTAMNNEKIKREAGVAPTGRKSNDKPVYSFSLAWQPEQQPSDEHMKDLAFDALELLGLKNHEAVFVAHQDTNHPHVHVITNLVNPDNGKTLRPQNDRLRFSTWAESYEKEHGKIYCEERVINNEIRRNGQKHKHRESKIDQALTIQNLYNRAESGEAFQQSLQAKGWTLAKGDRRGFTLVDEQGKIISLSRQLKGQRAKDIKERLSDLNELPHAQTLSEDRKHFYRDQYETDRQKKIVDDAITESEKRNVQTPEEKPSKSNKQPVSLADQLDKVREGEDSRKRAQLRKEQELRLFYKREEHQNKLEDIKGQLMKKQGVASKQQLQNEMKALQKMIADIDSRMKEQGVDPIHPTQKDYSKPSTQAETSNQKQSPEELREQKREEFRQQQLKNLNSNKDRGQDFDLER